MRSSHNIAIQRQTIQVINKYMVIGLPILSGLIFLIASWVNGGPGFPLDDAWIHQTYARNLVFYQQWVFNPCDPSAGSTSPLWTLLLLPASFLPFKPFLWTYTLGLLAFGALVWVGVRLADSLQLNRVWSRWVIIVFLSFEYHLVWASDSGMETMLASLLVLGTFLSLAHEQKKYWLTGMLIGCGIWVRPDMVTLAGPALMLLSIDKKSRKRIVNGLLFLGALLVVIAPYLGFNWALSGSIFPNTYFAKQIEYRSMLETSWFIRVLTVLTPTVTGAGVILIPGMAYWLITTVRTKNWLGITIFLWWMGFQILYAFRLPVIYQHGRYLMPSMPIYFIIGLIGSMNLLQTVKHREWKSRAVFFGLTLAAFALLGFYIIGMRSYVNDVSIIQSEMVDPSKWISENTPGGSVVASHDIGALGYFGNRKIIDLAGLIQPEVIPIIRNENALMNLMKEKHVTFLMTFPGWYEQLDVGQEVVYHSTSELAKKLGGDNMTVYRWVSP